MLASGNGLISIEPIFRKSLSIGSLVKGTNLSLDLEKNEDVKAKGLTRNGQSLTSLIGSPKKASKKNWPLSRPMGKSKPRPQKGHERPPEKAVVAPQRKPKISLDFKPEPSAPMTMSRPKTKMKAVERPKVKSSAAIVVDDTLSSDIRKVGKSKSMVFKASEKRPFLPKAKNQGQSLEQLPIVEKPFVPQEEDSNDEDEQGLVLLPPLSDQRPSEENEGHHVEPEGQRAEELEEGESIYDANHITDRILRNVKEMRKGVQPKQLQDKIRTSNEVIIPKSTNAVRIEKKVIKALAKAVAQPESPKRSVSKWKTVASKLAERERKMGMSVKSSRYPTETEDAFDFGNCFQYFYQDGTLSQKRQL